MNYVIIYIFLVPFKKIMYFFKRHTKRNLVIQTSKIGDFINITPTLRALGTTEILISDVVTPLVHHDKTITKYFIVEKWKKNLFTKLKLAFKLMNRYDTIYLLQPNSMNLFLASLCNAANKNFLHTYANRNYHKIFYMCASHIIYHSKRSLTINSYLKLVNQNYSYQKFPKHATFPLFIPNRIIKELITFKGIKIGISIGAGNPLKIIPANTWYKIINGLNDIECTFFIFGKIHEKILVNKFFKKIKNQKNIINLVGKIKLEELPWALSQMNFYISSDSGNAYIADAVLVPVILLYGPCAIREQKPINNVLFIKSNSLKQPTSFVFDNKSFIHKPKKFLFNITKKQIFRIINFIKINTQNK